MEVPCPVPLSEAWSPVGYQVVQVSEEKKLPVDGGPPKVKGRAARSPLGYRVNVVADEDIPLPPRPKLQWSLKRNPPRTKPALIWAPIVAGGFFFLLPVIAIAVAMGNQSQPHPPFAQGPVFNPQPMPAPQPPEVVIPEALFKAPANPPAEERPEAPQPAPKKDQAEVIAKEGNACETFGTQVEFVRNPQVAARMAREESKLTFLLHVSGNFEDSRFT
jgi:hypothetical protein